MGNLCPEPDYSIDQIKERYEMKNKAQAKALKTYVEKMGIKYKFVDKIHRSTFDQTMDVASDVIIKNEYLNILDMDPTPFALGALNTLDSAPKSEFFEFFCSVHHYCTYTQEQLIAHTFNLIDEDGSGSISINELAILVHHVYGEKVSKCEAGFIVTNNTTDIGTAKQVMANIDPNNRGEVNVKQFAQGIRKHANLLNPAFQTQQRIRRAVGGISMWKVEQERFYKHLKANSLVAKEVYSQVMKMLKVDNPMKTSGMGGLKKIGTHDLSGNRRKSDRDIEDENDDHDKESPSNGKKWKTAQSAVKGTNAFAHKSKELRYNKTISSFDGGNGGKMKKSNSGNEKKFSNENNSSNSSTPIGKLSKKSSGNEKKHLSPIIPNSPTMPAGGGRRSSMKGNNRVSPSPPSGNGSTTQAISSTKKRKSKHSR